MTFGRREHDDDLSGELRSGRPEPADSFVQSLVDRIEAGGESRKPRLHRRLVLSLAILSALAVAAAFGGAGLAASSADEVVEVATHAITPAKHAVVSVKHKVARTKPHPVATSPAHDQYRHHKITICHRTHAHHHVKYVTITISRSALPAHLAHGDTIGHCHHH